MMNDSHKQQLLDFFKKVSPLDADSFFNEFNIEGGLGRVWDNITGEALEPFERLQDYESLLKEIREWSEEIYSFIHKGTPFYFCGIHSFDIGAYDRAVFYFDAAFSEDVKNKPERDAFHWQNSAAYAFYRLDIDYSNPIVKIPTRKIQSVLCPMIEEFNQQLKAEYNIEIFVNKFVVKNIKNSDYRSIIPALYLFIYESEQRLFQLKIRSDKGGTIEPFIIHLLKGCLIFESLLKIIYTNRSSATLGEILNDPDIKKDLEYFTRNNLIEEVVSIRKTLPKIMDELMPKLENNPSVCDQWITLTYSLRNVTTHNLSWLDKFNLENYKKMYKSVLFSILYLLYRKF